MALKNSNLSATCQFYHGWNVSMDMYNMIICHFSLYYQANHITSYHMKRSKPAKKQTNPSPPKSKDQKSKQSSRKQSHNQKNKPENQTSLDQFFMKREEVINNAANEQERLMIRAALQQMSIKYQQAQRKKNEETPIISLLSQSQSHHEQERIAPSVHAEQEQCQMQEQSPYYSEDNFERLEENNQMVAEIPYESPSIRQEQHNLSKHHYQIQPCPPLIPVQIVSSENVYPPIQPLQEGQIYVQDIGVQASIGDIRSTIKILDILQEDGQEVIKASQNKQVRLYSRAYLQRHYLYALIAYYQSMIKRKPVDIYS